MLLAEGGENENENERRVVGPPTHPDSWFSDGMPLRDCFAVVRTMAHFELDEDVVMDAMARSCRDDDGLGHAVQADTDDAREELWEVMRSLKVVTDESVLAKGPRKHARDVWAVLAAHANDTKVWFALSWVPVYDAPGGGYGDGDRFEALLVEALVGPRSPRPALARNATSSFSVKKRNGDVGEFTARTLVALAPCRSDDVESVVTCVLDALPPHAHPLSSGVVEAVVLSTGFVGDADAYGGAFESDWDSDAAAAAEELVASGRGGDFPPREVTDEAHAHRREEL